jgi:hypothetical protein
METPGRPEPVPGGAVMSATEMLEGQNEAMRAELNEVHQMIGALHVLLKCAGAEAESANAPDAVRTIRMADNLLLRGGISERDGVKFGSGF